MSSPFHKGLSAEIRLELACKDTDLDLNSCIILAIKLDQHLHSKARCPRMPLQVRGRIHDRDFSPEAHPGGSLMEPPQSQWSWECPAYWRRRDDATDYGLCLYCGMAGHFRAGCSRLKVSPLSCHSHSNQQLYLYAKLQFTNLSVSVCLLLDSVAAGNFISHSVVSSLSIPVSRLASPISINALDGRPLSQSPIIHVTAPVCLVFPKCPCMTKAPVCPRSPLAVLTQSSD